MRVDALPQGSHSGFIQKPESKRHFWPKRHHKFQELTLTKLASLKPLTKNAPGVCLDRLFAQTPRRQGTEQDQREGKRADLAFHDSLSSPSAPALKPVCIA
jgi:hypothetical protein